MRPASLARLFAALVLSGGAVVALAAPTRAEGALVGIGPASGTLSSGAATTGTASTLGGAGVHTRIRPKAERPFHLGIVAPARPEVALDRVEPFRRRLADTLAGEATVAAFPDERRLIDAFVSGRIDYAPLSAAGYATAWVLCGCVEPLVAPRAGDGTAGYRAVIVARTGDGLKKMTEIGGHTMAISAGAALGTRRVPLMLLAREGFTGDRAPRLVDVDGPIEALRALLAGRTDTALIWSTLEGDPTEGWGRGTLHDLVAKGELSMTDVRVLWSSPVLPHGPQVVRTNLDEGRKRRLRDMLVDLDEVDEEAYAAIEQVYPGGFLRIGHAAYGPWLKLVTPSSDGAIPPAVPATTAPAVPPATTGSNPRG